MAMRLCVVSFKPCWQDAAGAWMSDGGFPLQMAAIASLFDAVTLVVVATPPRAGGLPLPSSAHVVGLRSPHGADGARKLSVITGLGYYVRIISARVREADVVHVPVPGDISFVGLLLALIFRKRLIARYGSSWAVTPQTTVSQRMVRLCMRMCAGGRNVMLATGIGTVPPAPRMRWIFSTALTRAELQSIRPRLDRGLGTPPRLVYLGRLSSEKGVAYLLRALARLHQSGSEPGPQLTILGDGPERGALERQARELGIDRVVTFAGHLNREQLSVRLADADLCVQPSLTEGFSKAWLDAMAHGIPVLSSRVGAAPAVVGEGGVRGWLVAPGDDAALADQLRQALSGATDWPALRRRCRAFAEGWTLEAWAREIGQICTEHWGGVLAEGKLRA
jgi:glycosyltransferase involved in cell wall biosynthesis